MAVDAPDWQRIVTTVSSTGAMSDAPDWTRVVVGPGGTPIGGGGGGTPSVTLFDLPSNLLLNAGQSYKTSNLAVTATGIWAIAAQAYFGSNGYTGTLAVQATIFPVESNYQNSVSFTSNTIFDPQSTFDFEFYTTMGVWFGCEVTALPQHFYFFIKNAGSSSQPAIALLAIYMVATPVSAY